MKEFNISFEVSGQYRVDWTKEEFCLNFEEVERTGAMPRFSTRLPDILPIQKTPAVRQLNLSEEAAQAWRTTLPSQTIQYELGLKGHPNKRLTRLRKEFTPEQIERMHLADFLFDTEGIYFSVEEILNTDLPMTLEDKQEDAHNEYLSDLAQELMEIDLY